MIQLNSWKKLQIGHLCSGNGCFKREKTFVLWHANIISNIYFYIYLRTHIYHEGIAIYTVWVWNTFFWCLNHTSANYSICFSSHYQMHFWMQMRCKTCLNFEMSVVKTFKKKILVSRFLLDAVGLEWLCSCLSVQSEQDKEPKTDQL